MSRAVFLDLIVEAIYQLEGFNQTELYPGPPEDEFEWDRKVAKNQVFHNYSLEERPLNDKPFIILRWQGHLPPRWQRVRSPEQVNLWVHWPAERTTDYMRLIDILDVIDKVMFETAHDLEGNDGYTLSFVQIGSRSGDLLDSGFNTITKNASYELFSRKST